MKKFIFIIAMLFVAEVFADPVAYPGQAYRIRRGTTLPSDCTTAADAAKVFIDTDATSGQQVYACEGLAGWKLQGDGGAGGGAPTDADYLVGTTNGSLSAEIVVGTSPGGELGGTWGTPTIDDSVTTTGWAMGAFSGTTYTASAETFADALGVEFEPGDALTDCSTFAATGGGIFYDDSEAKFKKCQDNTLTDLDTSSAGAPADADYLVGTANGSLSAEIAVGTTPGGELGNTWASPTLDDSVTVTGWALGASTATTLNKLTLTTPATGSTLTIIDGKTLTVTNTVDLAATVTDEQVCNYEGTGTQINCDIAIDATTTCAAGSICGGGHTHPTTEVSGVNAGTDLTADLEEEAHVSEHQENGADELLGETLGTACSENQILKANASGGFDCGADADSGGATAWNAIGDAAADGSVAFGGTTQTITGDTNDVTAITQDMLHLSYTNDAVTDILAQRGLVIENLASTNGMEVGLSIENADTDDAMVKGIEFVTAAGAITTAIDATDPEIGTALSVAANDIVGTTGLINYTNFDVEADGDIVSAGKITLAGTASVAGALGYNSTQAMNTTYGGITAVAAPIHGTIATGVGTQSFTNSVATDQDFTSMFTFPANSIYTNKVYRLTLITEYVSGTSSVTVDNYIKMGSTKVYSFLGPVDLSNGLTRSIIHQFYIFGRAAAGASAAVSVAGINVPSSGQANVVNQPINLATNGTLTINLGVTYSGTGSTETVEQQGFLIEELN